METLDKLLIILAIISLLFCMFWKEYQVQGNKCPIVSDRIQRAMNNMGPGYKYKFESNKLYVNTGNGWEILKY